MISSGRVFLVFLGVMGVAILVGGGGAQVKREVTVTLSRVHERVVKQGVEVHQRVRGDVQELARSCRRTYEELVGVR